MSFTEPPFWAVRYGSGYRPLNPQAVEVAPPAVEPVSVAEAKDQCNIDQDVTTFDNWLSAKIPAARRQAEKDLGDAVLATRTFDQYTDRAPNDRVLPLVRWPVLAVTSVSSFDQDNVETTLAASEYRVETSGHKGYIVLNTSASWPSSLRASRGLRVRHICGFTGVAKSIASITRASQTATVTTAAAHGYVSGNRITIAGAAETEYNGIVEITVTSATVFTYAVAGSPTTPATGTLTATHVGSVPETYTSAMLLLIGHWYMNREAVLVGSSAQAMDLAYFSLLSDAPVVLA